MKTDRNETLKRSIRARIRANAADSRATTIDGLHRYAMLRARELPPLYARGVSGTRRLADLPQRPRLIPARLEDATLASDSMALARGAHPSRRNWNAVEAVARWEPSAPWVDTIDHGRYSSRCTYRHYTYTPRYRCGLFVARSGAGAFLAVGESAPRWVRAPAGLRWDVDGLGARLVAKDGTDWHPTLGELGRRDFMGFVRARMTAKRAARRVAKRAAKRAARRTMGAATDHAMMIAIAPPVPLVRASLAAGNCRAGTETWLRKLGVRRLSGRKARPMAVVRLARRKGMADRPEFQNALEAALAMA